MEMEVALELLPTLAKRSLLQNSQEASLDVSQNRLFFVLLYFDTNSNTLQQVELQHSE